MVNVLQNMVGMGNMTEQVIATDLLVASQGAIKSYAKALSTATSPEVTNTLQRQMDVAINSHERISNYMQERGYYHPYDPQAQFRVDMQAADTVLSMDQMS